MQDTPKLGHLITGPAGRDAVHTPIAPVEAAELLFPGEHVGLDQDGRASRSAAHIGYVDPELPRNGVQKVWAGQRFYLCLFQGTVTSLRHVFTHPAFKPKVPGITESKE